MVREIRTHREIWEKDYRTFSTPEVDLRYLSAKRRITMSYKLHDCITGGQMGTLTIRIEDELDSELEKLARSQHRTKSDLVRDMLRKRIAVEKFRALRRQALPLAEAAGYLTDEDTFRDIS
jgi:predicted transcriptional regulator